MQIFASSVVVPAHPAIPYTTNTSSAAQGPQPALSFWGAQRRRISLCLSPCRTECPRETACDKLLSSFSFRIRGMSTRTSYWRSGLALPTDSTRLPEKATEPKTTGFRSPSPISFSISSLVIYGGARGRSRRRRDSAFLLCRWGCAGTLLSSRQSPRRHPAQVKS